MPLCYEDVVDIPDPLTGIADENFKGLDKDFKCVKEVISEVIHTDLTCDLI